jgi:hypothetical protein
MKRTDADKVSAAQELVDRLLAQAETLEYNASKMTDARAEQKLIGRSEGFKRAALMLDELL